MYDLLTATESISCGRQTKRQTSFTSTRPGAGRITPSRSPYPLSLSDSAGTKWDASEVANLVFQRGIAPYVVLKAPFNYRTAEFSSRLDVPISVHPVGRSLARHSGVSYYLIVAGEGVMKGGY